MFKEVSRQAGTGGSRHWREQAQEGAGGLTLRAPHETRLHCGSAGPLSAIIWKDRRWDKEVCERNRGSC